jgi:hypothetical protein
MCPPPRLDGLSSRTGSVAEVDWRDGQCPPLRRRQTGVLRPPVEPVTVPASAAFRTGTYSQSSECNSHIRGGWMWFRRLLIAGLAAFSLCPAYAAEILGSFKTVSIRGAIVKGDAAKLKAAIANATKVEEPVEEPTDCDAKRRSGSMWVFDPCLTGEEDPPLFFLESPRVVGLTGTCRRRRNTREHLGDQILWQAEQHECLLNSVHEISVGLVRQRDPVASPE